MAICPFATWMPVINHGGAVTAHQGLVIHVEEGDGSIYGWANNPASEVSATFWCGKDGSLEQLVDTDIACWAQEAGNYYYAAVETEGYDTEPLTTEQIATLGRLYAWGHQVHSWPLQTCDHGGTGLTTHAHYPSEVPDPAWGDHPCPGALRSPQVPAILNVAVTLTGSGVPEPSPPATTSSTPSEEDTMEYLVEATGTAARAGLLNKDGSSAGDVYIVDTVAKVKRPLTSEAEVVLYQTLIPASRQKMGANGIPAYELAATPTA